jgi:hypothetical protein
MTETVQGLYDKPRLTQLHLAMRKEGRDQILAVQSRLSLSVAAGHETGAGRRASLIFRALRGGAVGPDDLGDAITPTETAALNITGESLI